MSIPPHAVASGPERRTDKSNFIGKTVLLVGWDTDEAAGWFVGTVHSRGPFTQSDLKKVPTANFVVKYSKKATGGKVQGTVACELSEKVYGADMWWVMLRADAHSAPPTSQSSNGGVVRQSSSGGGGVVRQSSSGGGGASSHGARRPPPSPDRPSRKRAQAVAFKAGPAPPPRKLAAVARSGTVAPGELGEL